MAQGKKIPGLLAGPLTVRELMAAGSWWSILSKHGGTLLQKMPEKHVRHSNELSQKTLSGSKALVPDSLANGFLEANVENQSGWAG